MRHTYLTSNGPARGVQLCDLAACHTFSAGLEVAGGACARPDLPVAAESDEGAAPEAAVIVTPSAPAVSTTSCPAVRRRACISRLARCHCKEPCNLTNGSGPAARWSSWCQMLVDVQALVKSTHRSSCFHCDDAHPHRRVAAFTGIVYARLEAV